MRKRPLKNRQGFTLIEIIVSLLIVAILVAAAVPTMNSLTGAHMKTAAQKLAGNIKYLYDRAVLEQVYIRMVFDFEQNAYWSESTKDRFFLQHKPMETEQGALVINEEEEDEEEEDENWAFNRSVLFDDPENYKWQGWGDIAQKFRKQKPSFSNYKTDLSKKTELPKQVALYQVATQNVETPVTAGKVYLHFFPNGFVEKSAIWLANASDLEDEELAADEVEVYSVVVQPLTGRSQVFNHQVALPEDRLDEEQW